ncbi:hypothetical protein M3226_02540 [Neobacillus cucumis]|uniref:hypothetical protein n=1 Tax=Neobacillus cucumis TaxID=1740721 RepID=UPI00203C93DC|nr:hypothetical protein [Neobacillus cucumis]MCM3724580.1 hypothetical protein [Neobacillus cucumis]
MEKAVGDELRISYDTQIKVEEMPDSQTNKLLEIHKISNLAYVMAMKCGIGKKNFLNLNERKAVWIGEDTDAEPSFIFSIKKGGDR